MILIPYDSLSFRTFPQVTPHRRVSPQTASRTYTRPKTTSHTPVHTDPVRPPWPGGGRMVDH